MYENFRSFKKLGGNTTYLLFLQIINFSIPLFVYPYLSNSIKQSEFSYILITFSILNTFVILNDYGFNQYGTYKIASKNNDVTYINKITNEIILIKAILFIPLSLIVVLLSLQTNFYVFKEVIFTGLFSVFFQIFQPLWYFQGKNYFKKYFIYMSTVRILFILLIFNINLERNSAIQVILIWSISNFVGSLISIKFLIDEGHKFYISSLKSLKILLIKSFEYFISRAAVSIYTTGTTFILGFFDFYGAAVFSIAEQFYRGVKALLATISQAVYPIVLKNKDLNYFYKVTALGFVFTILISLILYFFGGYLITELFEKSYFEAVIILRYLSFVLLVHYFGLMFGYPLSSLLKKNRISNISVVYGLLIFILISIALVLLNMMNSLSMVVSIFLVETFVFLFRVIKLRRIKLK